MGPVMAHSKDADKPLAEAVFDNVEVRYYETPPISIGIEKTVRLHWPAYAGDSIEGAPTVEGSSWELVNEPVTKVKGFNQMTVTAPTANGLRFFRLPPVDSN